MEFMCSQRIWILQLFLSPSWVAICDSGWDNSITPSISLFCFLLKMSYSPLTLHKTHTHTPSAAGDWTPKKNISSFYQVIIWNMQGVDGMVFHLVSLSFFCFPSYISRHAITRQAHTEAFIKWMGCQIGGDTGSLRSSVFRCKNSEKVWRPDLFAPLPL